MKDSAIQWTDHTFNPWEGCAKVAPECNNCYAETLVDQRFGRAKWGKGQPRRRTSEQLWKQPLKWNREAAFPNWQEVTTKDGRVYRGTIQDAAAWNLTNEEIEWAGPARPRVFCLSLGDWLDEEVPIEWFVNLLEIIHATQNLDWQLLTKRPQNWQQRASAAFQFAMENGAERGRQMDFTDWLGAWTHAHVAPENIWIGVSAGADQKAALEIPAKVHFLSCEPMLHALDTTHAAGFDWIIFGGESGKNARPCDVNWIREGVSFCRANGVAPFVKQLGRRPYFLSGSAQISMRSNRHRAAENVISDLHGGDMSEWPEDLRVMEFPGDNARLRQGYGVARPSVPLGAEVIA